MSPDRSGSMHNAPIDDPLLPWSGGVPAPGDTRFPATGDERCARGTGSSSNPV